MEREVLSGVFIYLVQLNLTLDCWTDFMAPENCRVRAVTHSRSPSLTSSMKSPENDSGLLRREHTDDGPQLLRVP